MFLRTLDVRDVHRNHLLRVDLAPLSSRLYGVGIGIIVARAGTVIDSFLPLLTDIETSFLVGPIGQKTSVSGARTWIVVPNISTWRVRCDLC